MPTLTQPGLSMLIDRLFAEADAAENERRPATRADDREDYRQYYGLLKDQPLPVSRTTGRLLYMLARSVRARISSSSARRSAFRRCIWRQRSGITAADG